MSKKDYYEILGLAKEATDADLKRCYRKLARQYHPDVNKEAGAEEMFKELSEAYAVLSDPQQRAAYDRYGHAGLSGFQGGGGYQGGFEGFGGLGDIFEAFFGRGRDPFQSQRGGGSRSRAERGSDLRLDLEVEFRDAIFGIEREINLQHLEPCETCTGSGLEPGTDVVSCQMCRGSGQIQQHQRTAFGTFTHIATCPKCQGKGNIAENPCKTCKGAGRSQKKKALKIKIPPGIDSGVRLHVSGEGDAGLSGGPAGDLYIVLHVQADPEGVFEREEQHIYTHASVGYAQASLGDKIEIPTLEGPTQLEIPAGTQPGTIFTLKNKGVPYLNNSAMRGDLLVTVDVAVPRKVAGEEKALLESLFVLEKGLSQGEGGFSFNEEGGLATAEKSGNGNKDHKKHGFFDVLKETWKSHQHSKED
jgi:molecular chaperone DnaJ